MTVGELLHKNMTELDMMGQEEIGQWLAYIIVKNEREAAEAKKRNKRKNKH